MRFPFVIAVILTLIVIALPPLILLAAVNLVGVRLPPFGLLLMTVIIGYYLGFEVASRFGPKPFTTPLTTYLNRYKTARDRVTVLGAEILGLLIADIAVNLLRLSFWSWLATPLLALLITYSLWLVFGSSLVRTEVTPKALRQLLSARAK